jgi:hypothetical protein
MAKAIPKFDSCIDTRLNKIAVFSLPSAFFIFFICGLFDLLISGGFSIVRSFVAAAGLIAIMIVRVATIKARPRLPMFYLSRAFGASLTTFCLSSLFISVAMYAHLDMLFWPQGKAGYWTIC